MQMDEACYLEHINLRTETARVNYDGVVCILKL